MNGNRTARMLLVFAVVLLIAALPLTALATAEEDTNRELARHWIEDFILTGSPTIANSLTWPGLIVHSNGNDLTLSQVKARSAAILENSIDNEFRIIRVLAKGDLVAVHWVQSGRYEWPEYSHETQAWSIETISIMRFVEGRIIEIWEQYNRVTGD